MIRHMSKLFVIVIGMILISSCNSDTQRKVKIETEYGDMVFELYDSTPLHRDNFIKLTSEGFYNDLLFHRIIRGFMVQGGDPNSKDAPAGKIKGTLAAARQGGGGNPLKKSSGSQFYIVQGKIPSDNELNANERSKEITYSDAQRAKYKEVGGTPMLDMDYTVFGEIVTGMDVIDKLAAVKTAPGDRPIKDVKMKISVVN